MTDNAPVGRFPIEETAVTPMPGMAAPNTFSFSQDGAQVAYLAGSAGDPTQRLWALNTVTGERSVLAEAPGGGTQEEALSLEEELRRQRERKLSTGITNYSRAERADRIVVTLLGSVYVLDGTGTALRLLVDNTGRVPAQTPALSPDGASVAYVQDDELYVVSAEGGTPRQITTGARETGRTHGLAEYAAQEELDRGEGFWWSPDGRALAYAEVDETHIPLYPIVHQGKDTTGAGAQEDHRYPFAGQANASVRLFVAAAAGGEPVEMDLDLGEEIYLARAFWWRDGRLGAVLLNRPQTQLWLVRFDPASGRRETVLREANDVWVNVSKRPLRQLEGGGFLWLSERSGYMHVYLYDGAGQLVRQLTDGEWVVDAINGVDERRGLAYVTGNRDHPTEAQLYAAPLAGGELRRVTPEPGTHDVTIDAARGRFVDLHTSLDTPPTVTLRSLEDGGVLHTLHTPDDPRLAAFALQPPELVTLRNHDGVTLHGAIYRPPAAFGPGPYPTIVDVYGGPHAQTVTNAWKPTVDMDVQYLRSLGYLVFKLDNRGMARRGLDFERPIYRRMGSVEVCDQVDGVRWLVERGLADPARVGVMGWSYGGYMALMCLAQAPDVFRVAVAGAPVTAWDGYDTAYTERYMGTPQSNPEGYAEGSVQRHVEGIRGKLLLVHGLLDENVHFRHTARLVNALIHARKPYELLLFPDERHMPRHLADRVYLNERVIGYFQQHL